MLLLSGCAGSAAQAAGTVGGETPSDVVDTGWSEGVSNTETDAETSRDAVASEPRPDPETDVLGWENGYWYDDPLDVNATDGIDDEEMAVLLARTMARVEHIRGHEFTREVRVRVMTREEYAAEGFYPLQDVGRTSRQLDQFYEAAFFVGEDENATEVALNHSRGFPDAYYLFFSDEIVVVADEENLSRFDETLLAHELGHALQDEYVPPTVLFENFGILIRNYWDHYLVVRTLVEGDPSLMESFYAERCAEAWDCVTVAQTESNRTVVHGGMLAMDLYPYSDGTNFTAAVYERGLQGREGWDAVDLMYELAPSHAEQVTHPDQYPFQYTAYPLVLHAPSDGWLRHPYPFHLGEPYVFAMFWYQSWEHDAGIVNASAFFVADGGAYDRYNYTSVPSTGWDGDTLVTYHRGEEDAYVWATKWDTERDAVEFHDAYLKLLGHHGAVEVGPNTYVVPSGPYADAFCVELEGREVLVVNAPEVTDIPNVRPGTPATEA
ncbi:hypothetical protein SAMN04488124_2418 [Halogeometricum limi]|uniref:Uncharacterized protein n=2 Tax=Halogeometricum limi TaxID=555875 RepID=A0A1I6HN48_9EURY|nr:hypothetical protein SAMN04488124_2418 [Halogeometricum limi]